MDVCGKETDGGEHPRVECGLHVGLIVNDPIIFLMFIATYPEGLKAMLGGCSEYMMTVRAIAHQVTTETHSGGYICACEED